MGKRQIWTCSCCHLGNAPCQLPRDTRLAVRQLLACKLRASCRADYGALGRKVKIWQCIFLVYAPKKNGNFLYTHRQVCDSVLCAMQRFASVADFHHAGFSFWGCDLGVVGRFMSPTFKKQSVHVIWLSAALCRLLIRAVDVVGAESKKSVSTICQDIVTRVKGQVSAARMAEGPSFCMTNGHESSTEWRMHCDTCRCYIGIIYVLFKY
jgi:hypothetical protein